MNGTIGTAKGDEPCNSGGVGFPGRMPLCRQEIITRKKEIDDLFCTSL